MYDKDRIIEWNYLSKSFFHPSWATMDKHQRFAYLKCKIPMGKNYAINIRGLKRFLDY